MSYCGGKKATQVRWRLQKGAKGILLIVMAPSSHLYPFVLDQTILTDSSYFLPAPAALDEYQSSNGIFYANKSAVTHRYILQGAAIGVSRTNYFTNLMT